MTSDFSLMARHSIKNINLDGLKRLIEAKSKIKEIWIDSKTINQIKKFDDSITFKIDLMYGSYITIRKLGMLLYHCDKVAFVSDFLNNNSRIINQIFELIIDLMNEFNIKFFIGNLAEMNVFTIEKDGSYDFWGTIEVILSKTDYYLDILQMFLKQRIGKTVPKKEIQQILLKHNCITQKKGVYIINLIYKTKDTIHKTRDVIGNIIRDELTSKFGLMVRCSTKDINLNKLKRLIEKRTGIKEIWVDSKTVNQIKEFNDFLSFRIELMYGSSITVRKPDMVFYDCDKVAFVSDFLDNNSRIINQIFELIIDLMNEFNIKFFIGNIGIDEMNGFTIEKDGSYDFWGTIEVILSKTDYYLDILQMFLKQRIGKTVPKKEIQQILLKHNCITQKKGVYIVNLIYKTKDITTNYDVIGNWLRKEYNIL